MTDKKMEGKGAGSIRRNKRVWMDGMGILRKVRGELKMGNQQLEG
jgi:hypothetical protein